jgi:DNA polymerase
MFVGEAPGADEDEQGLPFVGASGKLLNKMLADAKMDREAVFVTNVCRCRPPKNRTPTPEEVGACKGWLWKEMQLVNPLVVIPLGGTPSRLLMKGKSTFKISAVVGKPHKASFLRKDGIILPMYHPSFLLRGSNEKVKEMVKVLIKARNYINERIHQSIRTEDI